MQQELRRARFCGSMVALVLHACSQAAPPLAPTQPPQAAPAAIVKARELPPVSTMVPWLSQANTRASVIISGKAVAMVSGQRCVTYRTLPFLDFQHDTLIRDACLEILNNTTIAIRGGTTLGIIATHGMRIGKNVRISANGTQGRQGNRADFKSITYAPGSDAEINAACVDSGNHCTCPVGDSNALAIRGHAGEGGSPGGFVRLVANNLVSASQLKGLAIDVSGGIGGPPGESGKRDCTRGAILCSSNICSDGASNGIRGADGLVTIAVGVKITELLLSKVRAATVPSGAITVVPIQSKNALESEVELLSEAAFNGGWDRRSGQEAY